MKHNEYILEDDQSLKFDIQIERYLKQIQQAKARLKTYEEQLNNEKKKREFLDQLEREAIKDGWGKGIQVSEIKRIQEERQKETLSKRELEKFYDEQGSLSERLSEVSSSYIYDEYERITNFMKKFEEQKQDIESESQKSSLKKAKSQEDDFNLMNRLLEYTKRFKDFQQNKEVKDNFESVDLERTKRSRKKIFVSNNRKEKKIEDRKGCMGDWVKRMQQEREHIRKVVLQQIQEKSLRSAQKLPITEIVKYKEMMKKYETFKNAKNFNLTILNQEQIQKRFDDEDHLTELSKPGLRLAKNTVQNYRNLRKKIGRQQTKLTYIQKQIYSHKIMHNFPTFL